ncbi:NmrA family NAD(P)-binding protein [Actinophytocola sp. KF-1]
MIVVTTPTGRIGGRVVGTLLDRGEPVRVVVRDPARLPARVRDRAEVVAGSHGDPDVVAKAFAGADAVFWVTPADPRAGSVMATYLDFTRPACEAFVNQGVGRVVGVSALGRGVPGHAGHVTASLAMDDMIAATGVPYRALANPSFMDNLLRQVAAIRDQGVFFGPLAADRAAPFCDTRDIADVATRLLLDPSWTGAGEVAVLGPEDLSQHDMARVMSEVLGKPVRYRQVPYEAFKESLLGGGMSEAMAQAMVDMVRAKDDGLDNALPRTPENTTPTSFRQWCAEVLRPAVAG